MSVTDPDMGVQESLTITLTGSGNTPTDANGTLAGAGLTKTGTGTYALAAANPAALSAELDALTFTPTQAEVAAGQTVTTGFTLAASQTAGGSTATSTDSKTTVTATALKYINGPANGHAVLIGTPGADVITAHGMGNAIFGEGGDDTSTPAKALPSWTWAAAADRDLGRQPQRGRGRRRQQHGHGRTGRIYLGDARQRQ